MHNCRELLFLPLTIDPFPQWGKGERNRESSIPGVARPASRLASDLRPAGRATPGYFLDALSGHNFGRRAPTSGWTAGLPASLSSDHYAQLNSFELYLELLENPTLQKTSRFGAAVRRTSLTKREIKPSRPRFCLAHPFSS